MVLVVDDKEARRRVNSGEVHFLQKPFDMTTLAREVRSALDERSQRSL